MLWYNLKITLRHFTSQKNISVLNLLGLAIGMTVAILIFYFVNFEMNYDNFHKNSERIYRIISVQKGTAGNYRSAYTPLPFPETVRRDIKNAELITGFTGFLREDDPVLINDQTFFNLRGYATDTCFLQMFNFRLLTGNPKIIFEDPGLVVLTEATAKKLFGQENPAGRILTIGKHNFSVAGIMKDLPENSLFKFNLLASHLVLNEMHPDLPYLWWYGGAMAFVRISPGQDPESVKKELSVIPEKYLPDFMKGRETYDIQPLEDIHLDNKVLGDAKPPVSKSYLYILLVIAGSVLFIACANFVNLWTSLSEKRARETGIRKISGGGRFQITRLFLGEAVTLSLIALGIAVFLSELFLPWFNELSLRNLSINFTNGKIFGFLLLSGILTGAVSGLYPALIFSKYKPVRMFHSGISATGSRAGFRKGFIIAQFLITIILITCQLFITKQIVFMRNHDVGFNKEDLLSVPLYYNDEEKRMALARVLGESIDREAARYGISGFTISENVPGQYFPNKFAVIPEGSTPEESREIVVTSIDERFTGVYQIPLLSGRIFSGTIASDTTQNVLVNETAASKLGFVDPVGKKARFKHEEQPFTIVGVLKDINFKSLQTPIEPVIYRFAGRNWLTDYITIRVDHVHNAEAIRFIETTWEKLAPGVPFQYFFIKDKYLEKYAGEERIAKIVGTFSVLAIFLSCLGLYAMISFLSVQRTKEIGIRKINGATVSSILYLLNRDFIVPVAVAYIIAVPVSWYILNRWLQNFPYRTELSWWVFALAGMLACAIAILTVSWLSWRAATRNPVEALRYE